MTSQRGRFAIEAEFLVGSGGDRRVLGTESSWWKNNSRIQFRGPFNCKSLTSKLGGVEFFGKWDLGFAIFAVVLIAEQGWSALKSVLILIYLRCFAHGWRFGYHQALLEGEQLSVAAYRSLQFPLGL